MRVWILLGGLGIAILLILMLLRGQQDRSRSNRDRAAPTPAEADLAFEAASSSAEQPDKPVLLPGPVNFGAVDRDRDLHGRVVRAADGAPVPGARLQTFVYPWRRTGVQNLDQWREAIPGPDTRSARDGSFSIRLRYGELASLRIEAEGFAAQEFAEVQAGERLRVALEPGVRLTVNLTSERGEPIVGADVRLFRSRFMEGVTFDRQARETDSGRYVFEGLPGGVVAELDAVHPRFGSSGWLQIPLPEQGTHVFDATLPDGRTLRGRVIDAGTMKPVANARVGMSWVLRPEVRTNADGRYVLHGWTGRGGVDTIELIADGYGQAQRLVADATVIDFELQPGDSVTGRIVGADDTPVAAAFVTALKSTRIGRVKKRSHQSGRSASDGRFLLEGLRRDLAHTLIVAAPGHARTLVEFEPHPDEPGTIDLGDVRMAKPGIVEGVVLHDDGSPAARVAVNLQDGEFESHHGRRERRRTDDLGRFRFIDQPPSDFYLWIHPLGGARYSQNVSLPDEGGRVSVTFRLPVTRAFRLTVVDDRNRPVPGAWVTAYTDAGRLSAETGALGEAVLAARKRVRKISVWVPDREFANTEHEFEEETDEFKLVLRGAAMLRGVLLDDKGRPIADGWVRAIRPEDEDETAKTDAEGRFEIALLPGETVDLELKGVSNDQGVTERDTWTARLEGVTAGSEGVVLRASRIERSRALRVRVLLPDGSPAKEASVYAHRLTHRVDENGVAEFEGLPDMTIRVGAYFDVHPLRNKMAHVVPPARRKVLPKGQEITLRFRVAARIAGRFVDVGGKPVPHLDFRLEGPDELVIFRRTDAHGRFEIRIAADQPGPLRIKATHDLGDGSTRIAVKEGVRPGQTDLEIRLE